MNNTAKPKPECCDLLTELLRDISEIKQELRQINATLSQLEITHGKRRWVMWSVEPESEGR